MSTIVKTQAELDAAIASKAIAIELHGSAYFEVRGSSQVRAYDSSQVTAYGSSQVRAFGSSQVTAYDSSQVTACGSSQVRAYDSSQVRAFGSSQVRACGSSQVTACGSSQVTACGSSQVTACGSSQVRATKHVAVTFKANAKVKVTGGVQIKLPALTTASEWCEFYGLETVKGVVTLYKALNADYSSPHKGLYTPGTTPEASDWDGGKAECGGGLHFSPRPFMALAFHSEAKKFVACPVKLSDMRAPKETDSCPEKIKAKRVCAPCYECDIDGNPVAVPKGGA